MSAGKYITKDMMAKILAARKAGKSTGQIAKELGISNNSAWKYSRGCQRESQDESGGGSMILRETELEDAPKARGEAMRVDMREKLPELPEGYNLDGTPKVHFPAPAPAGSRKGRDGEDGKNHPHSSGPQAAKPPSPTRGRFSEGWAVWSPEGEKEAGEGDKGRIASLSKAARNDGDGGKKQAGPTPEERAEPEGEMPEKPKKAADPKPAPETGKGRRTKKSLWVKGEWVQMEMMDGACSLAFIKEPTYMGEDAGTVKRIAEEIAQELREVAEAMGEAR